MSNATTKTGNVGLPLVAPSDVPMAPYRYQREANLGQRNGEPTDSDLQAERILRSARMLESAAASPFRS